MKIFKYFGIDVGKDTLDVILTKMDEKGLGNFSVVPEGEDGKPAGMLLVLSDPGAVSCVKKALEEYEAATENEE